MLYHNLCRLARKITLLDGWGDYIYDAEKLATLSGRKMAKKRNHVNQYLNLYGSDTYEPLSKANIKEVELYMSGLVTSDVSTAKEWLMKNVCSR